jgi:hypothetical protein
VELAEHMRTSLALDALDMAITHGHVHAAAVFHSDRGCQGGFNGAVALSRRIDRASEFFIARSTSGLRSTDRAAFAARYIPFVTAMAGVANPGGWPLPQFLRSLILLMTQRNRAGRVGPGRGSCR